MLYDSVLKEVPLSPKEIHEPGVYEGPAFVFWFEEFPDRRLVVPVRATITECIIEKAFFEQDFITVSHDIYAAT